MTDDQEDTAELPAWQEPEARQPAGASSLVELDLAALSHPGNVRQNNEDHFFAARFDRSMRTLQTNLPESEAPRRYAETVYACSWPTAWAARQGARSPAAPRSTPSWTS